MGEDKCPPGESGVAGYVSMKKKCGLGQPPRPHLLCVNLTAACRAPCRFRSGDVANACPFPALSCGGCTRARKRDCIRSRGWSQSRHARPFLRRPQRPVAHNAFTFREPQQSVPCIAQADHLACRSRALRSVHQAFRSASDKLSG